MWVNSTKSFLVWGTITSKMLQCYTHPTNARTRDRKREKESQFDDVLLSQTFRYWSTSMRTTDSTLIFIHYFVYYFIVPSKKQCVDWFNSFKSEKWRQIHYNVTLSIRSFLCAVKGTVRCNLTTEWVFKLKRIFDRWRRTFSFRVHCLRWEQESRGAVFNLFLIVFLQINYVSALNISALDADKRRMEHDAKRKRNGHVLRVRTSSIIMSCTSKMSK